MANQSPFPFSLSHHEIQAIVQCPSSFPVVDRDFPCHSAKPSYSPQPLFGSTFASSPFSQICFKQNLSLLHSLGGLSKSLSFPPNTSISGKADPPTSPFHSPVYLSIVSYSASLDQRRGKRGVSKDLRIRTGAPDSESREWR